MSQAGRMEKDEMSEPSAIGNGDRHAEHSEREAVSLALWMCSEQ